MSRLKITNARRKQRVRNSLRRTASGRPRLSVFRSSKHIYAQVIDDLKGQTLASASSLEKSMREAGTTAANHDGAKAGGKLLAERAVKNGVKEVVFDRGGYLYHGRVKALADAARESGLRFERIERIDWKNTMAGERERGGGHRGGREERDSEFVDKLVHINRVAKVVKGGKRFGFAALVVIGDQKGRVGFGHGKAREVPEAIRKATESARRNLTRVALREGRTLHHDIAGRHGAGRVYLRSAPAGTGIIAGGPMRAVFESLGVQDVVAKSIGSPQPPNHAQRAFDDPKHQDSPRSVAARRNIKVSTLQSRRVGGDGAIVAEKTSSKLLLR